MNRTSRTAMRGVSVAILMMGIASLSFAQSIIVGERVEMVPPYAKAGDAVTIKVYFRVERAPLSCYPFDFILKRTGETLPPRPTVVGASPSTFNVGSHSVDIPWTIPSVALPPGVRFEVIWRDQTHVIIRDINLESLLRVSSGTGSRVEAMLPAPPPPGPPTVSEGPDLRVMRVSFQERRTRVFVPLVSAIAGPITVDTDALIEITVQNIGRQTAENVRTHVEYNIADRWVPFVELETIRRLDPGRDKKFEIQRVIPRGATGIKVIVDPYNQIREMDEGNNTFIGYFGRR